MCAYLSLCRTHVCGRCRGDVASFCLFYVQDHHCDYDRGHRGLVSFSFYPFCVHARDRDASFSYVRDRVRVRDHRRLRARVDVRESPWLYVTGVSNCFLFF